MFYFVFTAQNQSTEFLVLENEQEVLEEISNYAENMLFCFNPNFIAYYVDFDNFDFDSGARSISMVQGLGEEANPLLKAAISSQWDEFIKDVIHFDGAGSFLSMVDGEELFFTEFCEIFGFKDVKLKELLAQAKGSGEIDSAALRFYQQQ